MKGKVIFNDTCKICFNYGIYTLNDSKFIKSVIHLFDKAGFQKIYPKLSDLTNFRKVFEVIQNGDQFLEKYKSYLNLNNDEADEKIKLFKKILKCNNIFVEDDLIRVLVYNENDDKNLKEAVKELEKADFISASYFNKNASLCVFLLTQRYYESELFIEHLDEAIQDKKETVFISNKSDTFIKNDEEFKNFRMFKFDTTAFKNISDSLNKKYNDESNKLVQFIRTYQKLVSNNAHIFFIT
jgi:hypothetical protein